MDRQFYVEPRADRGRYVEPTSTEYIEGRRPIEILELDRAACHNDGQLLWRFVFGSIIEHGVFTGDLHPVAVGFRGSLVS